MFSRAVGQHEHSQPQSSQALKAYSTAREAFKPSPASSLNSAANIYQHAGHNPLKRTASQVEKDGSWQSFKGGSVQKATPNTSQTDNRVGRLHFDMNFDENDFVNDNDIDLDEEVPSLRKRDSKASSNLQTEVLYPKLPSATAVSYPTLPSRSTESSETLDDPTSPTILSSNPLPWSSSPLEHRQPLSEQIHGADGGPKPTKRRKLPWSTDDQQTETRKEYKPLPDSVPGYARNKILAAKAKHANSALQTPNAAKNTATSAYPWNTNASAVKEQQKRMRQDQRKQVKSLDKPAKELKPAKEEVAPVFLSDEQLQVLKLVTEVGKSVFFTGPAGTGKSVLLREIIRSLRTKYRREPDRVAVTASTGLAACNVGGVTLHSFAGIGLGKEPVPELVRKIKRNAKSKTRWLRTKVLIVDEISMVDGELFDKLEEVARTLRNNGRPFGGIKLVITGDFFQLPPVPEGGRAARFSFDAATWNTSIEHTIGLTHVFRQKDPVFANMLNEMRVGKMSNESTLAFRKLCRPLQPQHDFVATELFPTRIEVDNANSARMSNLHGKDWVFDALDSGTITDIKQRDKLLSNCMAPQKIVLKKGAQVMLIKNIDDTLVNGSVGKVIAFMNESTFEHYLDREEDFQGQHAADDESMAEAREKIRQKMNPEGSNPSSIRCWPMVRFTISDGTTRDLLCNPEPWKIELPSGEVQAQRTQVPLILAWALSIHKAQGQTLDRVKVDMGKIFEKGQAYVALSRATSQEGLQVTGFDPRKVMAHDRVRTFYDGLYSVQTALASKDSESRSEYD